MDSEAAGSRRPAAMTPSRNRRRRRMKYEGRIVIIAIMAGLPGSLVGLIFLWLRGATPEGRAQWTLTVLIVALWLGFAMAVRDRVVFPLQTISNLLSALREGDFSVRGRAGAFDDALGEVMREVNTLGGTLREQRLGALEATTLLRTVMSEIDVAVFAFDHERKLRLVNRAGERLLAAPAERVLGASAEELHLETCIEGEPQQTFQMTFPGGAGRWGIRRSTVREHGLPLQLLVVADLTLPLRQQELQAWQRLVRVLGHELNNSLTPIKSIAGSLGSLLTRHPLPTDWEDDMRRGLSVISTRSEALSRFIHRRLCAAGQAAPPAVGIDGDPAVGATRGQPRNPAQRGRQAGTGYLHSRRPGPTRTGAHQPAAQCRGCVADHRRRRPCRLDAQRLARGSRHRG